MAGGRKILIIDDDAALRHSLAEQLQLHEEFQAAEAETGAAALDMTRALSMSACPPWTGASLAADPADRRGCARNSASTNSPRTPPSPSGANIFRRWRRRPDPDS